MSRLDTALRASLESLADKTPVQHGLEEYMDVRDSLESLRQTMDLTATLEDLMEQLQEVETVVEFSKEEGTLTEDQVHLHTTTVEKVRSLLDGGDVTVVSVESIGHLTDLLTVSQEASGTADGLLKRMWDAFVALLESIWNGLVNIVKWITGANRKAKQVCKEETALIQQDKVEIKKATPESLEAAAKELPEQLPAIMEKQVESNKAADVMIIDLSKSLAISAAESKETLKKVNEVVKEAKAVRDILSTANQEPTRIVTGNYNAKDERDAKWDRETKVDLDNIASMNEKMNRILSNPLSTYKDISDAKNAGRDYSIELANIEMDFFKYSGREDRLEKLVVDIMRSVNETRSNIKRIEKDIVGLKPGNEKGIEIQKLISYLRGDVKWMTKAAVTIQRFLQFGYTERWNMSKSLAKARKKLIPAE